MSELERKIESLNVAACQQQQGLSILNTQVLPKNSICSCLLRLTFCFVALFLVWLRPAISRADEKISLEYQLKAVCLYNFAKYVTWPAGAFSSEDSPISICIVEPSPFGDVFDALAQKTAQNRPVTVKTLKPSEIDQAVGCHIIYYAADNESLSEKIKKALKGLGILTVTEDGGIGIIRFVMQDGKVRFEINLTEAKAVGLVINSQVLKLAISIIGDE